MTGDKQGTEPQMPRGATWHAIWVLPLLVVLAVLLVPWNSEPAPVFDSAKMKVAAERWAAATGRRLPGSTPPPPAASVVEVRVVATPSASAPQR